jgi:hypothetical protein
MHFCAYICIINSSSVLSLANLHVFGKVTFYYTVFIVVVTCVCFAVFGFHMFSCISNQQTPWNIVLEKLIVYQLVQKFPALYLFITVLKRTCPLSLS